MAEPPGPAWLRKWLGTEFFSDVVVVNCFYTFRNDDTIHLKQLTSLDKLAFHDTNVTDAGLEHIKELTKLTALYLKNMEIGDAGLQHLKGLTSLEHLHLVHTEVTDEGVKSLQRALPNCEISHSNIHEIHDTDDIDDDPFSYDQRSGRAARVRAIAGGPGCLPTWAAEGCKRLSWYNDF